MDAHQSALNGYPLAGTHGPLQATRCGHGGRHWFAYYGWVGSSAPTCRHCGDPNPRYDPTRDPFHRSEAP